LTGGAGAWFGSEPDFLYRTSLQDRNRFGVHFASISNHGGLQTTEDEDMERRRLFSWLSAIPLLALNLATGQESQKPQKLKIMMKSAWGSDDPTRAAFPFLHGLALAEAGHDVQIFLLGESTYIMRKATVEAMTPVGWPPLLGTLEKVAAKHIPIFACGACCRARGVTEADLNQWGAKFGSPTIFVSLVEWADRIITE
jgi:predicted peroxiredoxin